MPGTQEVWDDLVTVVQELDDPDNKNNKHTFVVPWSQVEKSSNWIPKYHREIIAVSRPVKDVMNKKWEAQDLIDSLRLDIGNIVT